MRIRPLNDRVVVRRHEAVKETASGIILSDGSVERPSRGIVVAVGSGRVAMDGSRIPIWLSNGDTVVFGKYAGVSGLLDDDDLVVLKEDEIICVIEPEEV